MYVLLDGELLARAYAPAVALPTSYAQFLPIVERFDTLFESLGWLTRPKNT